MIEICLEQDMSLFQHPHLTWLPVSIPYTGELPARYLWRTGPQPCISLNFTEVGEETVIQRQCLLAEPTIIPSLGNLNKGIHKKIIQGKRGNKWKISRHLRDTKLYQWRIPEGEPPTLCWLGPGIQKSPSLMLSISGILSPSVTLVNPHYQS